MSVEGSLLSSTRTIRFHPTNAVAHTHKGMVLEALGRREEALAAYEQAIRLEPAFAEARHKKDQLLRALGKAW